MREPDSRYECFVFSTQSPALPCVTVFLSCATVSTLLSGICFFFFRFTPWQSRSWALHGTGTPWGLGLPCSTALTAGTRSREGTAIPRGPYMVPVCASRKTPALQQPPALILVLTLYTGISVFPICAKHFHSGAVAGSRHYSGTIEELLLYVCASLCVVFGFGRPKPVAFCFNFLHTSGQITI